MYWKQLIGHSAHFPFRLNSGLLCCARRQARPTQRWSSTWSTFTDRRTRWSWCPQRCSSFGENWTELWKLFWVFLGFFFQIGETWCSVKIRAAFCSRLQVWSWFGNPEGCMTTLIILLFESNYVETFSKKFDFTPVFIVMAVLLLYYLFL